MSRPGGGGSIPACPAPGGLQPFTGTAPARAAVVWSTVLTRSFTYDLHNSDRAWWSTLRRSWRDARRSSRALPPDKARAGPGAILYAGALRTTPQFGVQRQYGFLKHYCGPKLADTSYAIVSGPGNSPGLQGVSVFLNRQGHVLLYYSY